MKNEHYPAEEPEQNQAAEDSERRADGETDAGKGAISADLIRGHINTIILRTLDERDKYGYEIINEIEEKSHGQYTLKQPTLYSALKRLESQGYIKAYWKTDEVSSGGRRKYFTLTELGREYSEKNQSEWEYSRTVIDSLISDRSFDFSRPAPTPVDFNILKKSVSRVYTGGKDEENQSDDRPAVNAPKADERSEYAKKYDEIENSPVRNEYSGQTVVNDLYVGQPSPAEKETAAGNNVSGAQSPQYAAPQGDPAHMQGGAQPAQPDPVYARMQPAQGQTEYVQEQPQQFYQPAPGQQPYPAEQQVYQPYTPYGQPVQQPPAMPQQYRQADGIAPGQAFPQYVQTDEQERQTRNAMRELFSSGNARSGQTDESAAEEQRRAAHENFLKLIAEQDENRGTVPNSDAIDTQKLIYTNKPETERDYKKLVNNIFSKAIKDAPEQAEAEPARTDERQPNAPSGEVPAYASYVSDAMQDKARSDGLKVSSASQVRTKGARNTTFNKGAVLFACSVIIGIVLLIEFVVCISLMQPLGIGIMYPMTILLIGLVQLAVFGAMYACGYGRKSIRPASHGYVALCLVLTVIGILIICLVSFLLDINFGSGTDVAIKIVIPSVTALNVAIFGVSYYFLAK